MDTYRYERYEGGKVVELVERPYTAEEKKSIWQQEIASTDSKMPRAVEDIIDALDSDTRSRISPETLTHYSNKKEIRSRKP